MHRAKKNDDELLETDSSGLPRLREMLFSAFDHDFDTERRPANLIRAFRVLDANGSGRVSRQDFDRGLTKLGLYLPLGARRALFRAMDQDRDELVGYSDLQWFWTASLDSQVVAAAVDDSTDPVDLSRAMRRRRVAGPMGQELQRRFKDFAVGDALLHSLAGLVPTEEGEVYLLEEEILLMLAAARCPITGAEVRWLVRTFADGGEDERGFRLRHVAASSLVRFALGDSDPWLKSGGLEEILMASVPEDQLEGPPSGLLVDPHHWHPSRRTGVLQSDSGPLGKDFTFENWEHSSRLPKKKTESLLADSAPSYSNQEHPTYSKQVHPGGGHQRHTDVGSRMWPAAERKPSSRMPMEKNKAKLSGNREEHEEGAEIGSFLWCLGALQQETPMSVPEQPAPSSVASSEGWRSRASAAKRLPPKEKGKLASWEWEKYMFDEAETGPEPPRVAARLRGDRWVRPWVPLFGPNSQQPAGVRLLAQQLFSLYQRLSEDPSDPAVGVRALLQTADVDSDGVLGEEDLTLLALNEGAVALAASTVRATVEAIKMAAGPSLDSPPWAITAGELRRWVGPLDPALANIHAKCTSALRGAVSRARQATPLCQAAANLLRSAVRRAVDDGPDRHYDGTAPPGKVSLPALRRAVVRIGLPLSFEETTHLTASFPARSSGGPSGASARVVDFDALVHFLTT